MNVNLVNGGPQHIKKQEDSQDRGGGKDIKPVKTTLNRVPRSLALSILPPALLTGFHRPTLSRCLREFPIHTFSNLSP
jgi:hypothetical protein